MLLAVVHSGYADEEVSEPATLVRNFAECRIQWSASHIPEWCWDSDESGDSDLGETDDVNGNKGKL